MTGPGPSHRIAVDHYRRYINSSSDNRRGDAIRPAGMSRMCRAAARCGPFGGPVGPVRRLPRPDCGAGSRTAGPGETDAGVAGGRGRRRPAFGSRWLGKVWLVLTNPWLVSVHPITDSNIPGRGQHASPTGGGSAEVGNLFLRVRVCVGGVVI